MNPALIHSVLINLALVGECGVSPKPAFRQFSYYLALSHCPITSSYSISLLNNPIKSCLSNYPINMLHETCSINAGGSGGRSLRGSQLGVRGRARPARAGRSPAPQLHRFNSALLNPALINLTIVNPALVWELGVSTKPAPQQFSYYIVLLNCPITQFCK